MVSSERVVLTGRLLWPDGHLAGGRLHLAAGTIAAVVADGAGEAGPVIAPGLVDVQVNGVGDVDFASCDLDRWSAAADALLPHGVTTLLPTVITTTDDRYMRARATAAAAAGSDAIDGRVPGLHLEGPFLTTPGAHPAPLLREVDTDWLDDLGNEVRLVTLAPDAGTVDDVVGAVSALRARGIAVSLGHSGADAATARSAVDAGATMATHLGNAMGPLHHRAPGLAGVALTDERVAVGLIVDGVHVAPEWVRLAFAAKGPDGVVLVSDGVAWERPELRAAGVAIVDGAPRLPDGTLAGSALTLDAAIETAVSFGIDLGDALRSATRTPAEAIGAHDRGVLEPGRRADVVVVDDSDGRCEIRQTYVRGRLAFDAATTATT